MILDPTGKPVSSRPPRAASWNNAYEAAKRTGYRGYFYFPTLSPQDQQTEWTREQIAKKVNWLYNNVGAVSAVIDGLGLDECDTGLWPKAKTENPAFNREVTQAFHEECKDARVFHSAAQEDFYSAQWLIRRSIRLYGDLFGQLLRPSSDTASPQMHFVPGYQVGNAMLPLDQSIVKDGVSVNRLGRPVFYRTLTNPERTQYQDVAFEDMLHFHDKFLPGQQRGISGLAAVARKLYSIDDIEKAETSGTLLRARMAYAITNKTPDDGGNGLDLIPGAEVEEVKQKDGSSLIIQKIVARDGAEVDIADLPVGKDVKVLESSRGVITAEFLKYLLTDVALCTIYPAEYVFYLGGITQGTVARLVQNRVQRIINVIRAFQLIPQFIDRWYVYWLWQRIKSGFFDGVPGGIPDDWWRHKVILPRDMSVDVGREGKLYDDRLATGKMSGEDYHGIQGRDEEDVEDEVIEAAIRKRQKLAAAAKNAGLEISYNEVFVPPAGTAATPAATESQATPNDQNN